MGRIARDVTFHNRISEKHISLQGFPNPLRRSLFSRFDAVFHAPLFRRGTQKRLPDCKVASRNVALQFVDAGPRIPSLVVDMA